MSEHSPGHIWKGFPIWYEDIGKGKDRIKEINRAKDKGTKGVFWRIRDYAGLDFTNRREYGEKTILKRLFQKLTINVWNVKKEAEPFLTLPLYNLFWFPV
jgi:hypothetical protein